jgi:hypothetical protein
VPDRVGEPIRAFRIWPVDVRRRVRVWHNRTGPNRRYATLLPFNHGQIRQEWLGGERLVASCACEDEQGNLLNDHEAPDPGCRCGIYGLKEAEWLEQPLLYLLADELRDFSRLFTGRYRFREPQQTWVVAGSVLLWGKVIEGTFGYRAQYAYPERLWLLPPALVGGEDKTRVEETTVSAARDLLVTLRHRYRVPVGYAGHDPKTAALLAGEETGWFYVWRLTASGKDRFGSALGEIGQPTLALPTVRDALELWLAARPGGPSGDDRELVCQYLAPAFGHIPIDQPDLGRGVAYAPVSRVSGKPFAARTLARHRRIIEHALELAQERWLVACSG